MKHRLLLILAIPVFLLPLILPILPTPTAGALSAAADKAAKKYCNSGYPDPSGNVEGYTVGNGLACYHGYVYGYAVTRNLEGLGGKDVNDACSSSAGYTFSGSDLSACKDGFKAANKGTQANSPAAILAQEVTQACSSYKTNAESDSCEQGFTGEKNKKSLSESCKNAKNAAACRNGWTAAGGRIDPNETADAAKAHCKDLKGDEQEACIAGYVASVTGNSSKVCDQYNDKAKDACLKWADPSAGSSSEDTGPSCDQPGTSVGEVVSLSWIICPVVDGFTNIINGLDKLIMQQLSVGSPSGTTDPNEIFCDKDTAKDTKDVCQSYKAAWASFRDIALGFIVITALIIVIAQALGTELFDAYTIRKILPRLVIASVGVTLSWELMQFFVQLANDLGYGIRFLINQPFASAGIDQLELHTDGNFVIEIIGAGALATIGPLGLLSFALTAAIGVLLAFLVIVLRQIAIIILVILAPIAIVAYILPNTHSVYKMWWDTFMRALMMFPMIAALIAIGHVFSAVADNGSTIGQIIAFAAYFAPYFMIPLTYRFAGTAVSGIGNFVGDKDFGTRDRLKQFRGNKMAENGRKLRNYQRFSDKNPVGRGLNAATGAVANPGHLLRGRKGVRAGRLTGRIAEGGAALEKDKTYQTHKGDDNFLLAVTDRKRAKEKLQGAQADFEKARSTGDLEGMNTAQAEIAARTNALALASQVSSRNSSGTRLTALNDLAKTGFQFSPGERGYQELSDNVDSIVGNDPSARSSVMNTAQYLLRAQGQRPDIGSITHGAGQDGKQGIRKLNSYTRGQAKTDLYHGGAEAWLGAEAVDARSGKTKDGAAFEQGIVAALANPDNDTSVQSVAEWHSMLLNDYQGASDINKIEIQKQIQAIENATGSMAPEGGSVKGDNMDAMEAAAANHPLGRAIQNNKDNMRRTQIDPSELEK